MRNLKKVLSLVLALAMVLSICMVGAGAVNYDDFTDKGEITKEEAVATLVNLDVINGYNDGKEFRPQGNVTRAEMVTMICRVLAGGDNMIPEATKPVPTYTDVRSNPSAAWAETYIEYCTSLGIVSGKGNGIFDPMADVTAAEASKMVMTAVGYNADIEQFKGIGWDINTMAKASTLKLLTNLQGEISANTPVTREQVAQLIYNAMTIPMVQNYNGNTANLWIGSGANAYQETLMEKAFNAKKVTGAVIANEWASLLDDRPLDEGKTMLWLLDDEGDIAYEGDWDKLISTKEFQNDVLTVNASTTLEQIGSSVTVLYKTDTRQNIFGIVMDSGLNNTVEFEQGGKLETREMSFDAYTKRDNEWSTKNNYGTQYFINYDDQAALLTVSDYRIRYVVYTDAETNWANTAHANYQGMTAVASGDLPAGASFGYTKTIKPGEDFSSFDLNKIRDIFYTADRLPTNENPTEDQVLDGEVYVATQSKEDISDKISWKEFQREYLASTEYGHAYFNEIENGNYAKLVDCDNDGVAEFAFKIMYNMAEITRATERNGEKSYTYYDAGSEENPETDINVRNLVDTRIYSDDFAAGDIVVYTIIDGIAYVDRADVVTATVNKVSYRNESITTTDGDEYFQSGIKNETGYAEDILAIDEKVEYNLYLDKYGYVRIYKQVDGQTVYGLLTEAYVTSDYNHKYVTDYVPHVELKAGDERIKEFVVSNWTAEGGNEFFNADHHHITNGVHTWETEQTDTLVTAAYHLNLTTTNNAPTTVGDPDDRTFLYDAGGDGNVNDPATTNVARYTLNDDDTVSVSPATKYATTKSGELIYYTDNTHAEKTWRSLYLDDHTEAQWDTFERTAEHVYSVDYIRLDQEKITAKQRTFAVDDAVEGNYTYNRYVNAVHDTEFYLVQSNTVTYIKDYANLPEISKDKINAIYAVAENTNSDVKGNDYWVANVIVIELESWNVDFDSITLGYWNSTKTTSRVRDIDSLNTKTSTPKTTLVPLKMNDWAGQWKDFGFYKTYNAKEDGSELAAERIELVYDPALDDDDTYTTKNYNNVGIYAGTVDRTSKVDPRGGYIMVYMQGTTEGTYAKDYDVDVINVPIYAIGSSEKNGYVRATVTDLDHVQKGDRIIWVKDGNKVVFAVVSGYDGQPRDWNAPSWLFGTTNSQWAYIIDGQRTATPPETNAPKLAGITIMGKALTATDFDADNKATVTLNTTENATTTDVWTSGTTTPAGNVIIVKRGNNIIADTTDAGTAFTDGETLDITVTDGTKSTSYEVTVKVVGEATITVATTGDTTSGTSITDAAGSALTSGSSKTNKGADFKFKLTQAAGNHITEVTYTVGASGTPSAPITADNAGVYTIPGSAITDDFTINVKTAADLPVYVTVTVVNSSATVSGIATADLVANESNGAVKFKVTPAAGFSAPITVTVDYTGGTAAAGAQNITPGADGFYVLPNDTDPNGDSAYVTITVAATAWPKVTFDTTNDPAWVDNKPADTTNGYSIDPAGSKTLTFTTTTTSVAIDDPTGADLGAPVPNNGIFTWTLTNITKDVQITVG